jgi:hypothetical protein
MGRLAEGARINILRKIDDEWEQVDKPDWIDLPDASNRGDWGPGSYTIIHGDTFVYKVVWTQFEFLVFRQLKSDYHETTREEGTCPNCQAYVERYQDDRYLTCHRCGWQYHTARDELRSIVDLLTPPYR